MRNIYIVKIIEWALRINVGIKLFIYGIGKILGQQFYRQCAVPEAIGNIPLAETSGYNLAWTFFGYSEGYIWFIGVSQLIGAGLLLLPKTKLIGGAILVPILLNIIVVDNFFGVAYGALFAACFYLASILFMFFVYKEELGNAVKKLLLSLGSREVATGKNRVRSIILIVVVVVIVFYLEYLGTSLFGYEDRHY